MSLLWVVYVYSFEKAVGSFNFLNSKPGNTVLESGSYLLIISSVILVIDCVSVLIKVHLVVAIHTVFPSLSRTSKSRRVLTFVDSLAQVLIVIFSSYSNLLKILTLQFNWIHDKWVVGISLIPYLAISECMQATFSNNSSIPLLVTKALLFTLLISTLVSYSKIAILTSIRANLCFFPKNLFNN